MKGVHNAQIAVSARSFFQKMQTCRYSRACFPDQTQAERASHFGVSEFCVYYGLKTLGITRKKTLGNHKERCPKKRSAYQGELATLQATGKSVVYGDERGFRDESHRRYG